jgi:hypothetical protein
MRASTRIAVEAAVSALIALAMSLIVLGPLLSQLDVGWSGGDMLSTYVNAQVWTGFSYGETTQFGFPLGMNLNYFPGIDITENTFAMVADAITGGTFLGINLLVLLSFPLVAALAYLVIRMTGLQGPLAIALAVAFAVIPFHWGRALGHTYLSTLYSAVVGLALVLLIATGTFERLWRGRSGWPRIGMLAVVAVMCIVVAWTGVYYVAFTLILGVFALIWRFALRARLSSIAVDAIPLIGTAVLAVIGFIPSLLTVRVDPPLASLGERTPFESVTYAGNLLMAMLPIPQSQLPRLGYYNEAVLKVLNEAPYGESSVITNFGTWVSSAALVTFVVALVLRSRRTPTPSEAPVGLGLVAYLTVVTVLFFVPWGLNLLFAEVVTAQIRAWNRLLPFLLLLFILGAAAALHRTRIATRWAFAVPIALALLAITAVDTVYPFRAAYAGSVAEAGEATRAARAYASDVNAAIPADCGVLQLPYMAYPEHGLERGVNDYDHFWTSITNPGKEWSYGAVRNTDASIWAAQLPQVPTDAQMDLLRGAGFCAIHLDTRGYVIEALPPLQADLTARLGDPVATGFDGAWELYGLGAPAAGTPATEAFLHQPFVSVDLTQVTPRETALRSAWWWTREPRADFVLTPTSAGFPVTGVAGAIAAPECGAVPVTVTLTAGDQKQSTTVVARPTQPAAFDLALATPSPEAAVLTVDTPGEGCPVGDGDERRFAQVLDLAPR